MLETSENKKRKRFICRLFDFLKLYHLFEGNIDTVLNDHLTGLYKREIFYRLAEKYLSIIKRHNEVACVIMFDMDKLKEVNDKLGHKAGDRLLLTFADALKKTDRDSDISCRWGGDEFVSVIDGDEAAAEKFVQRVINEVKGYVSFSYGISVVNGFDLDAMEIAIKHADKKMYEHKSHKRENRF